MNDTPAVEEIQQQSSDENTGDQDGDGTTNGGGSGMFDGGIPTFGLSKRQLLLIGAVVVAVLAYKLHSSDSGSASSGTKADQEIEEVKDADLGDVAVTEDDDADEVEVILPANADDELDNDAAIIDYFKSEGIIEGEDD